MSASVTILTYGFLFQGTLITIIRKSPQFFLNINLRRMSAGAIRWSRILALDVLPKGLFWMITMAIIPGTWAGMGVGLWKLYTSNLSKSEKAGISITIFGVIFVLIPLPYAWYKHRLRKREMYRPRAI